MEIEKILSKPGSQDYKRQGRLDHIRYLNVYMVRDSTNKSRDNSRWEEIFVVYKIDKGFMSHNSHNSSYRIPTN